MISYIRMVFSAGIGSSIGSSFCEHFASASNCPPLAITFAIYGHYFRRICELHILKLQIGQIHDRSFKK